ncbi:coiled-coil domain-containing protein 69 isoform X3 [Hemicordylus capensis]|uniref:coiled-coil domain-containing protein 69 isoform X3 n=1 Tax=Hemicordylus capensis TaxID=884348 RepID=UPI002303DF1C|nr:coiled-coil domain-containing protein 69 isoform X3 [Hemicordylus capensis]
MIWREGREVDQTSRSARSAHSALTAQISNQLADRRRRQPRRSVRRRVIWAEARERERERKRKEKLKVKHEGGPASCELTALKIENANAAHVHEDVEKEKAEWLEKQRKEVTRLLQQHQEEKEYLKEAHQAETKTLSQEIKIQETIDGLSSQMKSFQEKMKRVEESILSRDYKKHIQDYGSPSQFWEQELESLHFVIEMKNERIHNLDKKLLNLETVTERNLLLEEKMKTLQQENEDLQVRMQNHMAVTRQLSDELLTIREALQKESQLREQAHREKEELLYRVLNGDSSHAFPLSTEAPLIAT